MSPTVSAFLLAAGMGTRLQPITKVTPKPLIPLPHGDTLLGTIIQKLSDAKINHFSVNGHYLSETLHDYLKLRLPGEFTFYHEPNILGTGGPLIVAKQQLASTDHFILHNGDILLDLDFSTLIDYHLTHENLFTLVALDGPENRLLVDNQQLIFDVVGKLGAKVESSRLLTYCGVGIFSKRFFDYLPNEVQNYSLVEGFLNAIKAGEKCGVFEIDSSVYWNDLGTVEKYLQTALQFPSTFQKPFLQTAQFEKIAEQGSARSFYRLGLSTTKGNESYVLMKSFQGDADFDRYVEYGSFLYEKCGITPKIWGANQDNLTVLNEDLGRTTLYDYVMQHTHDIKALQTIYKHVVETLWTYQKTGIELGHRARIFDYDYLRWETSYFKEHLLGTHLNMVLSASDHATLEEEFDRLAHSVLKHKTVFIHRDFQSQNIMVHNHAIRFVDFQGGRMGNGLYDVVSLAFDPYLQLPDSVVDIIFSTYEDLTSMSRKDAIATALQRLMQALGAYGFLSHKKGKIRYLTFIAPALEKLRFVLEKNEDYPCIKQVVLKAIAYEKQKENR